MRTPTPHDHLYAWHSAAMRGEKQPVHESEPHCGWFVRSYSYRGLLYPATIFMEQNICEETGDLLSDERMRCLVTRPGDDWPTFGGHEADPVEEWSYLARMPISKSEYTILVQQLLTANKYIGPSRPFVRWFDEREIAGDYFRYQGVSNAIGTD